MATKLATRSKTEAIQQYFRRQYEVEEGSAEDNVRAIMADDLVYRLGDGKVASMEKLIEAAERIRRSPKADRRVELRDLKEEGDSAWFQMRIEMRDPDTGKLNVLENDVEWRFDAAGRVVEIVPRDGAAVERSLKSLGVDLVK